MTEMDYAWSEDGTAIPLCSWEDWCEYYGPSRLRELD